MNILENPQFILKLVSDADHTQWMGSNDAGITPAIYNIGEYKITITMEKRRNMLEIEHSLLSAKIEMTPAYVMQPEPFYTIHTGNGFMVSFTSLKLLEYHTNDQEAMDEMLIKLALTI
jgi:hypothetical protein